MNIYLNFFILLMGTIINGVVVCCKKKDEEEEDNNNYNNRKVSNEIPKSLLDIKIESKNLVRKRTTKLSDAYEEICTLGSGAFGTVYKIKRKSDGVFRALKKIPKDTLKEGTAEEEIKKEINILSQLDHPNIMKIYEFYEDDSYIYIINEFCDIGDLANKTEKYGECCEFLVKYIMYQVFLAVNFLHINKVVHGDIKRENIALLKLNENNDKDDVFKILGKNKEIRKELNEKKDIEQLSPEAKSVIEDLSNYEIKLVDFGSAQFKKKKNLSSVIGTAYYCSPEVIDEDYGFECDEWACGVMMYILLSGYPPFVGDTEQEVFENIKKSKVDFNIPELRTISKNCKSLISKLLQKDPKNRITASEALNDDFFTNGIDISKLIRGAQKENSMIIKNFVKKRTKRLGGEEEKKTKFKDTVIAYIALNFSEKQDEKKTKEIFKDLSAQDKNFILSKKTFTKVMNDTCQDLTEEEISDLFSAIDENNSGTIEYQELIRALCDKKELLSEKNLKQAFEFFDQDNSGTITWNEIAEIIFKGKTMPENIIKEFLSEIGQNDENISIDFNEFKRIITK